MKCCFCNDSGWKIIQQPEPARTDGVSFSVSTIWAPCQCMERIIPTTLTPINNEPG